MSIHLFPFTSFALSVPPPHGEAGKVPSGAALLMALRQLYGDATQDGLGAVWGVSGATIQRACSRWCAPGELRAAAIRKMVKTRAKPGYVRRPPTLRYSFARVDWRWTDTAIARKVGCTIQNVQRARRSLGKPASPNKRLHETTLRVLGLGVEDRGRQEREITRRIIEGDDTCRSIGEELGLSLMQVYVIICRHSTAEQRRAAKRRKLRAAKLAEPSGFVLNQRIAAAHAQTVAEESSAAVQVRRVRECWACGAELAMSGRRCPKCGASAGLRHVNRTDISAPAEPDKRTARERIASFLKELEAVA